jgi:hypothetical protein
MFNVRSDECGRVFCYQENGTHFHNEHIQVKDGSGRKTVPVWAWFSADGPGNFVRINGRLNSVKYIEMLENFLLPAIRERFPGRRMKFVQDLSPIHTARAVKAWFNAHPEIELLPWPAKGADLNPIENIWGDIVNESEYFRPRTADEVFEKSRGLWDGFSRRPTYWQKLGCSIIKRLRLVLQNDWYWIKY